MMADERPGNPAQAGAGKTKAPKEEYDAGHVPMTEEMDSAGRTLPPVVPVAIALVVLAVLVAAYVFHERPKMGASAAVTKMGVVEQQDGKSVLVAIQMKVDNLADEKPLYIRSIKATLVTEKGDQATDEAAPAGDHDRFMQAYPELAQYKMAPIKAEDKIAPNASQQGLVMFGFQVTKAQFDARIGLTIKFDLYDRSPVVVRER